jgi:hypothetical protein
MEKEENRERKKKTKHWGMGKHFRPKQQKNNIFDRPQPWTTPCFQGRLHDYTPITMVPRT